ncbi:ATP-dependent RNA helicase dbp6 [Knufia peltigerae]|uniref:ATP-dependent RNA helicase n=1 Tax=Knufia peltigerae TaxID=1002370 RepID=A0AA38YFD2_9EURO|nr:ATP-dependent RNA helicase dbp6 [Knufia peltigerae]
MSNFYARYVPPAKSGHVSNPPPVLEKRKRDPEAPSGNKKSKKIKTATKSEPLETSHPTDHETENVIATNGSPESDSKNVIDKHRVTKHVSDEIAVKTKKAKSKTKEAISRDDSVTESAKRKDKRREKSKTAQIEGGNGDSEEEQDRRRSSVLSKFAKAKQLENKDFKQDDLISREPTTELHGLEPIPQPEQVDTVPEKPTYSTLPAWQQSPTTVPLVSTATFESLGVSSDLLENLKKVNIEEAFPVQASVVPLLLEGPSQYPGDVCVSAATGSGKTLAYVLPIISSLRSVVGTKLRAVIVVPTRELVKQVRELCEICAAGSSLTIATAVGSKTLREEQQLLVEEQMVYDMEAFQRGLQAKVDWSTTSFESLLRKVQTEESLYSLGYVTRYKSKADVLITTPGRLVEHLKNTPGFNLDYVKWLVVDEADRLLNESYQEWIDAVSPALESRAATRERDVLLESMRMDPPQRRVTKVLLSATMTRDISKLNALGLRNPKLIVLRGSSQLEGPQSTAGETSPNDAGLVTEIGEDAFHLPPSLIETAVPVPDGSEKPLYLLTLLKDEIGILPAQKNQHTKGGSSKDDSTSESDSSSDSDSDTTSDSESSSATSSSESSVTDSTSSDESDGPDQGSHKPPKQRKNQNELTISDKTPRALVFTRSTASANRLSRLLSLLWPDLASRISTLTRSTASSASSRRALSLFRRSKVLVLVCTDRASRGLDVPGLEHVISYDVPTSPSTYVHRVGRTARAGKQGQAWTIVEHREGAWFWREIGGKGLKSSTTGDDHQLQRSSKIRRLIIQVATDTMKQEYDVALTKLGTEARGS